MSGLKDLAQRLFSGKEEEPGNGERTSQEEAEMTERTLTVEGMSCGHCKAAVEEELAKLEGVEEPVADFEKGTVELRYDETTVTTDDIKSAVEEAGYALAS